MARRCRPTLRFLVDDLGEGIPTAETALDHLEHPILNKAHGFAPSHPKNQKRVEAIKDTLVFRFTHGRSRVATWLHTKSDIVWVCAEELRREGASDDAYQHIVDLHGRNELLPSAKDARRLRLEQVFRFQHDVDLEAPAALAAAERQPGNPLSFSLTRLQIKCELVVVPEEDLEEVWLSVSAISGRGEHLDERIRQFVFAAFKQVARAAQWDETREWPTRPLEWYEVALLGVRERRN